MKGFLVSNRINDIYFMDYDEEFARHVNKQACDQGLINEITEDESTTLEVNVVMQLFSPIFMSQWFMIEQRKNPCKTITCENGFVFVFQHIEDLLIVAINGDDTESEEYLTRKTCVFVRMVEFLFGPVTDEIGHSKFSDKQSRWYLLKGIMKTWNTLSLEEHAFLVEAIERVHINMIVNERCVDVLDHAVNRLQNAGEKNTYHGLLFVNSKLLTLYSGRNAPELRSSDTLAIILLIKHLFPTDEKLEDLFSFSYRKTDPVSSPPTKIEYHPSPTSDKYESAPDDMEEDEDKYTSAVESPIPDRGSDSDVPYPEMSITDAKPSHNVSNTPPRTPTPEVLKRAGSVPSLVGRERSRTFDSDQTSGVAGVSKQVVGSGRARSQSWIEPTYSKISRATPPELGKKNVTPPIPEEVKTIPFYQSHTVFLQNELCNHCPHQLHCIQVFPGITLILVSEMPKARLANTLCQILFLLKQLVLGRTGLGPWAQGQNMYDTINSLIYKLAVPLKRGKGSTAAILNDVLKKWDDPDFKTLLLNFLDKPRDTDIPPNIERSLSFLLKKMKDLFLYLYLLPRGITAQLEKAIGLIRERARIKLRDFKDYLSVKAQRNITMTSYIQQFPGLIHFVYIDRRTNQVTAPSFNIMSGETNFDAGEIGEMDATKLLKDKVWKMMEFMQLKLRNGITCIAVRDGDYYFSYFLWFGDSSGSIITPQNPINASMPLASPGVLSSNFYSILLRRCFPNVIPGSVACFELMMMHIGLVSLSLITDHRTKLTALLRSSSGEAISPVTLAFS